MKVKKKWDNLFFVGKYELTVLSDSRIILPTFVIRQLRNQNIKRLLPGRLPCMKALVLCPQIHWNWWINKLKKDFPCLVTHSGARTFLIPWQPITWDSKGRITLPRKARDLAEIKPDQTVILLGNRHCFELWSEQVYNEIVRDCEVILQKSSSHYH